MNKQMPKNVRKTAGVLMLTGVMAIGAFSLLKTGVLSTHVNKIATTANAGGEEGGDGGGGQLPDGGEGEGTTKPESGGSKFGLVIEGDATVINIEDALPQTQEAALKGTSYKFTLRNKGTVNQVVRLSMAGINKEVSSDQKLPPEKVNVLVRDAGSKEVVAEKISLADITASGTKGFGKPFKLDAAQTKNLELFAWVDESASLTDLYGPDGKQNRSIHFKAGGTGIQADVFTNLEGDLTAQFEEFIAKQ